MKRCLYSLALLMVCLALIPAGAAESAGPERVNVLVSGQGNQGDSAPPPEGIP